MAPRNKRTPRAGALPRILQCPRNANSLTCLGRFPPLLCPCARTTHARTPQPRSSLPSWAEQSRHCAIPPPPSRRARHPGGLDPPPEMEMGQVVLRSVALRVFPSAGEGSGARASIASSSRIRFPANGSTGTRPSVHMPNQRCWSPAAAPCQPGACLPCIFRTLTPSCMLHCTRLLVVVDHCKASSFGQKTRQGGPPYRSLPLRHEVHCICGQKGPATPF